MWRYVDKVIFDPEAPGAFDMEGWTLYFVYRNSVGEVVAFFRQRIEDGLS